MKSNVSDHLELVQAIYEDACAKCIADVSDLRDLNYIRSRIKDEGFSFLTITLPNFCREFENALQKGRIDRSDFPNFRKAGSIPSLLKEMIGLIFDRETGRIRNDPRNAGHVDDRSTIIDCVRQICLAFKKIELPCAPSRVARALTNFVSVEKSNRLFSLPQEDTDLFKSVSSVLWHNALASLSLQSLRPKHGPGNTADYLSGNRKYVWSKWHERLEPFFPFLGNAYTMGAYESDEFDLVEFVCHGQELPVRVVTVPKTMNGPRTIALEPSCMQFVQQAIQSILIDAIESSELTKGHVNFRDQSVNQKLALESSKSGQFVTIDLSDASDRVLRRLAFEMFRSNPDLLDSIDACRSTQAKMPDGTLVSLDKFASMGSSLCFPVESMYFYTICVAALLQGQNLPVNHTNVLNVSRGVFVYGDDLIVPKTYANVVLDYLQKYNCKVNIPKTFLEGNFRESCGMDAYDGEPVTPVYLRKVSPQNKRQAKNLISWVATANLFYMKGYWRTADLMFCTCERILGSLPYVSEMSSGLGRISLLGYRSVERWNKNLQRFEVKCWTPRSVYRSDSIDGYPALQKSLTMLESRDNSCDSASGDSLRDVSFMALASSGFKPADPVSRDARHLERTALYGTVALTSRWVPSQM